MTTQKLERGTLVRMAEAYKLSNAKNDDTIAEFGDCVGLVEGPMFPDVHNAPEVDVRWRPSRLRYGYDPQHLERVELRVTEGIPGVWHYHLACAEKFNALCGAKVMGTAIELESWGRNGNPELREKWCTKCADISALSDDRRNRK